jgi:hypothetical protein
VRAAAVLIVVLASLVAAGASPAATGECSGLPACIDVPGPWVFVPATGEAKFLLDCPRRQGVVGGVDALASSRDIHVTWDAQLGGPVAPGRTTTRFTFFRGVSGHQRPGFFQPRIGCIPSSSQSRQTTSARAVTPVGTPLDLAAATVPVSPGKQLKSTVACANHEHLVYSWDATAFGSAAPPPVAFASAIEVSRQVKNGQVTIKVAVSEAMPKAAKPIVQVGVACTK